MFDNFGRLKESQQKTPFGNQPVEDATARISKYTYNFSGALSEQEYPSKRVVKHEFEADCDLSKIHGKAQPNAMSRTYASGFTYTPDGRIEKLQLGNGLWESAKFDPARGQVTELALGTSAGDGSLWKLNYTYGELAPNGRDVESAKNTGNIAKQTLTFNGLAQPLVQTFRYDSLYRLTEARETSGEETSAEPTKPQTWKQVFDYDRFGNRTSYQKFVGTTQLTLDNASFATVNAADNRLNSGQGYSYDKNGNVIVDAEGRQFFFNGDNKQIEVKNASNILLGKYFFDGEGKRVKKKTYDPYGVEQEETVFVYDGMGKLVAEYSTKPPPQNPTTSYTATDQLGSPRVITNSLGEIISRRDFQPFGEELTPDATYRKTTDKYGVSDSVRQRFTGYQKDEETGLDFAEARMYENRHGRFTAVDPLLASGKSANPQTFNRYVYVMNNPLLFTDPTGLFGDYYDRKGKYLGSDGEKDGKRYIADFVRKEKNTIYVNVVKEVYWFSEIIGLRSGASLRDPNSLANRWENENNPKTLANRNEDVRDAAADVIGGTTGAGYNFFAGSYNLGAGGVNYFGGNLPYAPEFTPTSGGQSLFYYGTNAAMLGQGGVSLFNSVRSGINAFRAGGTTFGERLFNSATFGKDSFLFGNKHFSPTKTPGLFNKPGSFLKAGWSSTGAEMNFLNPRFASQTGNALIDGGQQLRVTLFANGNKGLKHLYVPRTFVTNQFANPYFVP